MNFLHYDPTQPQPVLDNPSDYLGHSSTLNFIPSGTVAQPSLPPMTGHSGRPNKFTKISKVKGSSKGSRRKKRKIKDFLNSSDEDEEEDYEGKNDPEGYYQVDGLTLFVMPRQRKKYYWTFMKLVAPGPVLPPGRSAWKSSDATHVYCEKCKLVFSFKSGCSNQPRRHMRRYHKKFLKALKAREQKGLAEMSFSDVEEDNLHLKKEKKKSLNFQSKQFGGHNIIMPKRNTTAMKEKVEERLTLYICKNYRPYDIGSDQDISLLLRDRVKGLHSLKIKARIDGYAEKLRLEQLRDLQDSDVLYSLSTDMFTTAIGETYMSITMHAIHEDFTSSDIVLSTHRISDVSSTDMIVELLKGMLEKTNLNIEKCAALTNGNCTKVSDAAQSMRLNSLSCFGKGLQNIISVLIKGEEHTLNVQSVIDTPCYQEGVPLSADLAEEYKLDFIRTMSLVENDQVQQYFGKCRAVVDEFRNLARFLMRSVQASTKLDHALLADPKLQFCIDNPMHWSTTLNMLRNFIKLKTELQNIFDQLENKTVQMPSGESWLLVELLVRLLETFEVLEKLSGDSQFMPVSLVVPYIRLMQEEMQNDQLFEGVGLDHSSKDYYSGTIKIAFGVRNGIQELLGQMLQQLPIVMKCATLLDPRYTHSNFLSEMEKNEAVEEIIKLGCYLKNYNEKEKNSKAFAEEESQNPETDKRRDLLNKLLQRTETPIRQETKSTRQNSRALVAQELSSFQQTAKCVPQEAKEVPLVFWKKFKFNYPAVAMVARYLFSISPISLPTKRLFSEAKCDIMEKLRLREMNAENIIFIHDNLILTDS